MLAGCWQRASKRFGPRRSEGFKAQGESRAALSCRGLLRDESAQIETMAVPLSGYNSFSAC